MRRHLHRYLHRFSASALALLAAAAGVGASAPAWASIVIALDLPSMVTRADHVAIVDVVSVKAAWDARHERILTTIDLAVVESWKGPALPASHFTLVQPGGTVGDTEMVVHGMTRFTVGERAVVFLRGRPEAAGVVGMAQGKRAVLREAATGRLLVQTPDKAGAVFVRAPAWTSAGPAPVFETRARPIEDLRAEVRALAAAPSQGSKGN
jgi:hypothetical protein